MFWPRSAKETPLFILLEPPGLGTRLDGSACDVKTENPCLFGSLPCLQWAKLVYFLPECVISSPTCKPRGDRPVLPASSYLTWLSRVCRKEISEDGAESRSSKKAQICRDCVPDWPLGPRGRLTGTPGRSWWVAPKWPGGASTTRVLLPYPIYPGWWSAPLDIIR